MFCACIDESGTHSGSDILSVACCAGTSEQWEDFVNAWINIIGNKIGRIFHAKDSKCDPVRSQLLQLMEDINLISVVVSINPADYRDCTSARFRSTLGNAYSALTITCLGYMEKVAEKSNLGKIACFIEQGRHVSYTEKILRFALSEGKFGIASVNLVNKEFVPIHTADFLAHIVSNSEIEWIKKVEKTGNVILKHITKNQMVKITTEAAEKTKALKWAKRKAKVK